MSPRSHTARHSSASPGPVSSARTASQPRNHPARTASSGKALDRHTQQEMSARFGHDFGHVRVHTDSKADKAAEAMEADAYTFGGDIVFGQGKYNPGSRQTEHLLAHELTHVVQQDRYGAGSTNMRSRRSDPSEREAESVSDRALLGENVSVHSAPTAAVSCFDPAYNDVKDDFWGTKSMLGNKWGNVADSAMNTVWDGIGLIPDVGSAASTMVDAGKAGYSEGMSTLEGWEADLTGNTADRMRSQQYHEAAQSFTGDMAVDATGMIPIYGTGQSALGGLWDGARTIDLATGGDPNGSPSFTDLQKQAAGGIWNGVTGGPSTTPAPDRNAAPDPDQPPPNMPSDPFQGMQ
ncbi:MAG TPA: DUF4157 domain-containing protein [Capsulimonadaceae bacterium]|nr:DUF4157 domain-containing protein [Capsulimonadaceae bacterium]